MPRRLTALALVGAMGVASCSLLLDWSEPSPTCGDAGCDESDAGDAGPTVRLRSGPPMSEPRSRHAAVLTPAGRVLVVGGYNSSGALSSTEQYEPATEQWAPAPSLEQARAYLTVHALRSGEVLAAGGATTFGGTGGVVRAELFLDGGWRGTGSLDAGRFWHTGTELDDGRVFVAGGVPAGSSTELYLPDAGAWVAGPSLTQSRHSHAAARLLNGKVALMGGAGTGVFASVELYDPVMGTLVAAAPMATARSAFTATLLDDGRVLVAGGYHPDNQTYYASAELYDPVAGTWSSTGDLSSPRSRHTAVALPDGRVLVAGGRNANGLVPTVELYDPARGTWSVAGALGSPRYDHTATLLPTQEVLLAGGQDDTGFLSATELVTVP